MKIFCDVDGVLRYLDRLVLGCDADTWDQTNTRGHNVVRAICKDPVLAAIPQPTEYLAVINDMFHGETVHLLTSQPTLWQPYTELWLSLYLRPKYDIIYSVSPAHKLRCMGPEDWLIEDSPQFTSYDQIVLIDKKYNSFVYAPVRVRTPEELRDVIDKIRKGELRHG